MIVQNTVKIAAYEHIQQDSTRYFYVVVICSLFDFYALNSCFIFWDDIRYTFRIISGAQRQAAGAERALPIGESLVFSLRTAVAG